MVSFGRGSSQLSALFFSASQSTVTDQHNFDTDEERFLRYLLPFQLHYLKKYAPKYKTVINSTMYPFKQWLPKLYIGLKNGHECWFDPDMIFNNNQSQNSSNKQTTIYMFMLPSFLFVFFLKKLFYFLWFSEVWNN